MVRISVYIGVILLAAAAIFLGFQIYQRQSQKEQSNPSETLPINSPVAAATSSGSKKTLSLPTAKASEILDITSCNPVPKNLELKLGQEFQVKNSDAIAHTIIIDAYHEYVIPAESTKTLSSTFGSSGIIGLIGYRCDKKDSEQFAGTFRISE